jgi:hypothetical protein
MTCDLATWTGAYVLGSLSLDDRTTFEKHLPDCTTCSRTLVELAGLPGLLSRVTVDEVDPPATPPE